MHDCCIFNTRSDITVPRTLKYVKTCQCPSTRSPQVTISSAVTMSTITTSIIRPSSVTLSPSSNHTHKRDPAHITLEITYPTATNSLGEPSPRLGFAFIDRDSAIALGVILILVLASVGWYFYLRIRNSRQDDLERLAGADRRASFGQPALRNYGSRGRAAEAQFRTHRLWSRNSRSVPRSTSSRSISGSTLRGSIKLSLIHI